MTFGRSSPFAPLIGGFDHFLTPTLLFPTQRDLNLAKAMQQQHKDSNNNGTSGNLWRAGLQFHEDDTTYSVSIDLPGVKLSDVRLQLEDDGKTVHLSGHRKFKSSTAKDGFVESKFEKRFTIGENVDTDNMNANLLDGVLTLTAPKKKPPAPVMKEIKIACVEDEKGGASTTSKKPAVENRKK